jgi:hypothetical protein
MHANNNNNRLEDLEFEDPLDDSSAAADIEIHRFGAVRSLWFITLSLTSILLLCLTLLFPKWISVTKLDRDDTMTISGYIRYDFDLKGVDIIGTYNSFTRRSYIGFDQIDEKYAAKSSALTTSVLVISAAVVQGIGVLMYRSTRVRIDGKDTKARIALHLIIVVSSILELSAILAYHLGNGYLAFLKNNAESVVLDSGSVMIIVAMVLDVVKTSCFFYNLRTSPLDIAEIAKNFVVGLYQRCRGRS